MGEGITVMNIRIGVLELDDILATASLLIWFAGFFALGWAILNRWHDCRSRAR
jgi:hypothetical protein